jgi:SulP family sulfate permease
MIDDPEMIARYSKAKVVYITGPVLFANTGVLEKVTAETAGCDTVLFSMRGVSLMDISGAQLLLSILEDFKARGVDIVLCGVPHLTRETLDRAGITQLVGEDSFYWSVERALLDYRKPPAAADAVREADAVTA